MVNKEVLLMILLEETFGFTRDEAHELMFGAERYEGESCHLEKIWNTERNIV